MHRIVRDESDRTPLDTNQCGDHAESEVAAQLQHRSGIGERLNDGAHIINAETILRNDVAQDALVGAFPLRQRPLEIRKILFGDFYCFGFVLDRDVDHSVGHLHIDGADFLGTEDAEPAAFDHRGTAHPDVGILRRDDDVATSKQRGIAGEASTRIDADQRHQPGQAAPVAEREAIEACDADAVGIARTTAAAFGKEHYRQLLLLGDLEHAILLAVILLTLRAGEHGVVVRHQDTVGFRLILEQVTVDGADARNHSVGGRVLHQVLDSSAAALGGDHDRAVLDERARVAQVLDIFARGALNGFTAPRDRLRPGSIEAERVPLLHFLQIVTDVIEIDLLRLCRCRNANVRLLDERERMALEHRVAFRHGDLPYDAADVRADDVLHLHRFHDEDLLARVDFVALRHIERNDGALHRRGHRDGALGTYDIGRDSRWYLRLDILRGRRAFRFPMMQHR